MRFRKILAKINESKTEDETVAERMRKTTRMLKRDILFSRIKYEYLVGGIAAGVVSTLALHPLDLLKIRFAVNDGRFAKVPQYTGLVNALHTIVREEGFRGLYKGVTPNVAGAGISWGLYFLLYNTIKSALQGDDMVHPHGVKQHLFAASESGFLTLLITNPLYVIKTRLCLRYNSNLSTEPSGMISMLRHIYFKEGFFGLYRGFLPGVLGISHGAVQFVTYEEFKDYYLEYRAQPPGVDFTAAEYFLFGASSKVCATITTYPYQVVRARLQDQFHNYKGAWDCVSQTWKYEQIYGFYKGMQANLIRVVPAAGIMIIVYETIVNHMLQSVNS